MPTSRYLPNLKSAVDLNERLKNTRLIYRVFHSGSQTQCDPNKGFQARNPDAVERKDLSTTVYDHVNWEHIGSPWISTTRRWLWILRRAYWLNQQPSVIATTVRIAVIDLDICRETSQRVPFTHDRSAIYALSLLAEHDKRVMAFADLSDEILVYDQIPVCAIISVLSLDNLQPTLSAFPGLFEWHLRQSSYLSFRDVQQSCAKSFAEDWDPKNRGELCAKMALRLLNATDRIIKSGDQCDSAMWIRRAYDHLKETLSYLSVEDGRRTQLVDAGGTPSTDGDLLALQIEKLNISNGTETDTDRQKTLLYSLEDVLDDLGKSLSLHSATNRASIYITFIYDDRQLGPDWDTIVDDGLRVLSREERSVLANFIDCDAPIEPKKYASRLISLLQPRIDEPIPEKPQSQNSTWNDVTPVLTNLLTTLLPSLEKSLIQTIHSEINTLRARALELARTIPLVLIRNVSQDEWRIMKTQMLSTFEREISPIQEDLIWTKQRAEELGIQLDENRTRREDEEGFPESWEESGMYVRAERSLPVETSGWLGRYDTEVESDDE